MKNGTRINHRKWYVSLIILQRSCDGDDVAPANDQFVFVVPGHLHLSAEQVQILTNNGQQPGVPFAISSNNGSTGRPDRLTMKVKYSRNLVALNKNSVKVIPKEDDPLKYSISFSYDALVPSEATVRFGVTDLSDASKIAFSYVESTWGPFYLPAGLSQIWDSKTKDLFVAENQFPSRRRKTTYANNYDLAITLTPVQPLEDTSSNKENAISNQQYTPTLKSLFNAIKPKSVSKPPAVVTPSAIRIPETSGEDVTYERSYSPPPEQLEQQIRHLQENQRHMQEQYQRHISLQQQLQQQTEEIERIQSSSTTNSASESSNPSANLSRQGSATNEPKPTSEPSTQPRNETDNGVDALFGVISDSFINISKQILSLTAMNDPAPVPNTVNDPNNTNQEYSETSSVTHRTEQGTDNIDLKYALTGGRNILSALQLYKMSDVFGDDDIARDGDPPPTRLASASFGVEANQVNSVIVRPVGIRYPISSQTTPETPTDTKFSIADISQANLSKSKSKTEDTIEEIELTTTKTKDPVDWLSSKHITAEVSLIRATGGITLGTPLGLRCYIQRVQHQSKVYYVNRIFGVENESGNSNMIVGRPEENQLADDENNSSVAPPNSSDAPAADPVNNLTTPDSSDPSSGEIGQPTGSNEPNECVICLTNPINISLFPCRHTCLCLDCATSLAANGNKCPICRRGTVALMNIKPSVTQTASPEEPTQYTTVNYVGSSYTAVDNRGNQLPNWNQSNNQMTRYDRPRGRAHGRRLHSRRGNDRRAVLRPRQAGRGTRITISDNVNSYEEASVAESEDELYRRIQSVSAAISETRSPSRNTYSQIRPSYERSRGLYVRPNRYPVQVSEQETNADDYEGAVYEEDDGEEGETEEYS